MRMRHPGAGQDMKREKGLAGWEHWGMTHTTTGKYKPCRDAGVGGGGRGMGRRGLHGHSYAESECVQGIRMLRVPLLLLKSLRAGEIRYEGHT